MADYIFLNPSPNMARIAKAVQAMGLSVAAYRNSDAVASGADVLHFFSEGGVRRISSDGDEQAEAVDLAYRFKRTLFGGNVPKKVRSLLAAKEPGLAGGTINDFAALSRKRLSEAVPLADSGKDASYAALCRENPESFVVTAAIPGTGNELVTTYETDFEVNLALGKGYFVFMENDVRVEAFSKEDTLVCVASKKVDPMDVLGRFVPSLSRFSFKKMSELPVDRNMEARVRHGVHEKNGILLNDYSFFDLSVRMPDDWYDRAGRYLCSGKRQ